MPISLKCLNHLCAKKFFLNWLRCLEIWVVKRGFWATFATQRALEASECEESKAWGSDVDNEDKLTKETDNVKVMCDILVLTVVQ